MVSSYSYVPLCLLVVVPWWGDNGVQEEDVIEVVPPHCAGFLCVVLLLFRWLARTALKD